MKRPLFTIAMVAILATACNDPQNAPSQGATANAETQTTIPLGDTSQNALDWPGVYEGVLPCASCEGIQTTLTLQADNSFELKSIYLGKDESIFKVAGKFDWDSNGSKIILSDGSKYLVGENQLFMLDTDGNRITGGLAENYILKKKAM
ncbi:copper resistance protein NlpE [Shewanella xiamenensis]|uniref:copper resistance protein NlpE n=1 Tax=Shewanella xiamenensis TaxID=332186 RepID=UPI0024A61DAE|nr:copper resistance protein NlpE [Shewanella xiamenensis]MDI5875997.1 copper resistance protein NlpE [Shewanella xiamenensis]